MAVRSFLSRISGVEALRTWTRQQFNAQSRELHQIVSKLDATGASSSSAKTEIRRLDKKLRGMRDVRTDVAALQERITLLEQVITTTDRLAPRFVTSPFDLAEVAAHAYAAITTASLLTDPSPHIVVDQVFPPDYYSYLRDTLPPPASFTGTNPTKVNFDFGDPRMVSPFTRVAWGQFEQIVIEQSVHAALRERFNAVIPAHYEAIFGAELAPTAISLPTVTRGRLLLRRPGYEQRPHFDPKRVLLTGILYMALPDDPPQYGTSLYRLDRPVVQPVMHTFYPETADYTCTFAKHVEYRANRLFAFINSGATHGAKLPADASLLERYAYQFYVKPRGAGLARLVKQLPVEQQGAWEGL